MAPFPFTHEIDTEADLIEYWEGQDELKASGMAQETCRDLEHTGYGLASITHVSEASRIQGRNLYKTSMGNRLQAALEFHTQYLEGLDVPSWLCNGSLDLTLLGTTGVGYNAFSTRLGYTNLTDTKRWTLSKRPAGSNGLFVAYETLTHVDNPK